MEGVQNFMILALFINYCSSHAFAASKKYYMDDECGRLIDMAAEGVESVRIRLTFSYAYAHSMDCLFRVQAPPGKKLIINILDMDIESAVDCADDFLQIANGQFSSGSQISGLKHRLCGNEIPQSIYASSNRTVTFRFVSDVMVSDRGFHIMLTAFRSAEKGCYRDEFQCNNAKRCISESLTCDGFNNCGDDSDECGLTTPQIIGIAVGCVVAAVIIGVIITCCCCWKRRSRRKEKVKEKEDNQSVWTSVGSVTSSVWIKPHQVIKWDGRVMEGLTTTGVPYTMYSMRHVDLESVSNVSPYEPTHSNPYRPAPDVYTQQVPPTHIWITAPPEPSHGAVIRSTYENQPSPA